jgi:hypothetical protein
MKACILFSARAAWKRLSGGLCSLADTVSEIRPRQRLSDHVHPSDRRASLCRIGAHHGALDDGGGKRRALIPLAGRGRRQCEALRRSGWSNRRRGTLPCRSPEPSEGGRIHFNQHSPR